MRIARLRSERSLSQSQLAEAIGVESQTISKYERGFLSPSVDTLFALADVFQCSERWLWSPPSDDELHLLAEQDAALENTEQLAPTGTDEG